MLQRWVLSLSSPGRTLHVIDVGANVGQWSVAMLAAAQEAGRLRDLDLHAFEPSAYTFERLSSALDGQKVTLRQMALSDRPGRASLHVVAPGAGTNSLHKQSASITSETVVTATLDAYAKGADLGPVTFVKIDTEGHDLAVLRGARELFSEQRILVAQFEYNFRWVYARHFLRDVFEFLQPFGYHLGKVTWRGVEFYPGWDTDLETFVEGNYVACAPGIVEQLPSIDWWKLKPVS